MMENNLVHSLDSLFTMCFNIDENFVVSSPTPALQHYFPETAEHKPLLDLFEIQRPALLLSKLDLTESLDRLFLLVAKDQSIALRGQILPVDEDKTFRFFGAPWLAWMSQYKPQLRFRINDFPIFDSQMDQRFHVATQDLMVKDLEKLTAQLIQARDSADEADRLKTDLFAVMSHEMRTPLHGVISALSLAQRSHSEAERKQLVEVAQKSASGLLNVINYALDYSKIEAGKMKLEHIEFGAIELLRNVANVTTGKAREKDVELITKIDSNVPKYFMGDQEKLLQILVNLTGNAIKFTDTGCVTLAIEIDKAAGLRLASGQVALKFSVTDTGRGIVADDLQKIFEPFWSKKGDAGADRGTGLGLQISKQLTTLMNSEILVTSKLGQGSVFSFTLALDIVSHPTIKTLQLDSTALPNSFSGRVLVVDDNLTNLMLTEMILKNLGLEVNVASSGQEAIDLAGNISFELILMDITMEGMDGIEATRRINQLMFNPPIVALTAHTQPEMIDQYRANGFKGYLRKPLEHLELIRELNLWLPAGKNSAPLTIEQSQLPVLNTVTLERLHTQLGEVNFNRVRELYIVESRRRLANLLAAWVRRDHEALKLEAHTLASSVSSFGCEDLEWRMRKIDSAIRVNDIAGVISYMKNIEKHAKNSLMEVETYPLKNSSVHS